MRMAVTKEEKKQSFPSTHRYWCKHVEPTKGRGWGGNMHPKLFHPNLDSHIKYDSLLSFVSRYLYYYWAFLRLSFGQSIEQGARLDAADCMYRGLPKGGNSTAYHGLS